MCRKLNLGNYFLAWERQHFKKIVEMHTDIKVLKQKAPKNRVDYFLNLDDFYKLEEFWLNDLSKRTYHKNGNGSLGKYLKQIRNYEKL